MKRFLVVLCLSLFSVVAYASTLSLYQDPDAKSHVIATVREGQAIVPIYTQGDWMKVGDPSNGNVGWVNKTELQKSGYPLMQVQVSGTKNPEEVKKMMDTIQKQQAQFEVSMHQFMQQNLENMTKLNQSFGQLWATQSSPDQTQQPAADKTKK